MLPNSFETTVKTKYSWNLDQEPKAEARGKSEEQICKLQNLLTCKHGGESPPQKVSSTWLIILPFLTPLDTQVHSAVPTTQLHSRPHFHLSPHFLQNRCPFNPLCLSHLESLCLYKTSNHSTFIQSLNTPFGTAITKWRGKVHSVLEFSTRRDLPWRNIPIVGLCPTQPPDKEQWLNLVTLRKETRQVRFSPFPSSTQNLLPARSCFSLLLQAQNCLGEGGRVWKAASL